MFLHYENYEKKVRAAQERIKIASDNLITTEEFCFKVEIICDRSDIRWNVFCAMLYYNSSSFFVAKRKIMIVQ
jgi:hypothetical protein